MTKHLHIESTQSIPDKELEGIVKLFEGELGLVSVGEIKQDVIMISHGDEWEI